MKVRGQHAGSPGVAPVGDLAGPSVDGASAYLPAGFANASTTARPPYAVNTARQRLELGGAVGEQHHHPSR